ncbi:MAG: S46 family peptidase [Bacteroidaceae bacterium]|nr:S46 family peptidase [Bacteroidaceae bacterium]
MKKLLFLFAFVLAGVSGVHADEGMWLPSEILKKIKDIQSQGFKLSAEDIYSVNKSSLKDAVVRFGGGCTGELISNEGLLITNHHCGFGQIQSHSSVEHDYLRDGFWAMSRAEELPNPGLSVSFLEYMQDVTDEVLKGYKTKMTEEKRSELIAKNTKKIEEKAVKGNPNLRANVRPLYYGNQYFLFVYKVYTDVRLVGAPPSSIGKFGGDTDNWMWPRHTGDFSIFRVYAGEDNEPAAYSEKNVPFRPKKFFKINARGIKEGDFTMVYGFPGSTREYLFSDAVKYTAYTSNPHKIALRTLRLDIQKEEMNKDQAVRIKYASKQAGVANAWKKWQGEAKGLIKNYAVENKQAFEAKFDQWAKGKPEYEGLVTRFKELYGSIEELSLVQDYQSEALNAVEIIGFAGRGQRGAERFYKDYHMPIDKACFVALYNAYNKNIADKYKSPYFKEQLQKFGSIEAWADALFTETPNLEMAAEIYKNTNDWFRENIAPTLIAVNKEINLLYRAYMKGQMEYNDATNGGKIFYPDANSTLRVTYGKVKGYKPADAIYYTPVSSLDGVIEKDNPEIYDYNIPQKLRDLHAAKDYGQWESEGSVPVAFIATNHTSGGNSGSPVLDAEGNLIGVNFDRVWEGTMSDVLYDPEICRNISLDIRFALFVIDKLAGASHLLEEMEILK